MEQLPRVNLTRFHGVFAPNSKWRAQVTPSKRGQAKKLPEEKGSDKSPAEHHIAMSWAQRLKRVFNCDKAGYCLGNQPNDEIRKYIKN